jgi:hypothetical protein
MVKPIGWRKESQRHALASKGISTGRKSDAKKANFVAKKDTLAPEKKVENWLKEQVDSQKKFVAEQAKSEGLKWDLIDGGTMDTIIEVSDPKTGQHEEVTTDPEWDDLDQMISEETGVPKDRVRELLESGVFMDLQQDMRIYDAAWIAMEYIGSSGFWDEESGERK